MLFKEKPKREKEKNPYSWPKCYYMEGDPAERKAMLDMRLTEDDGADVRNMKRLFDIRYQQIKGKYADRFMRGWLELLLLGNSPGTPFSSGKRERAVEKAVEMLCLDRTEEFGENILYDELCHLTGVYILSCQNDSKYRSVLFDFGRMKDEKVNEKIKSELDMISRTIPAAFHMEERFSLFRSAVQEMKEKML